MDWSTGLPNLPVNCIVNNNKFNGSLYAATDVGVYYRDANMNQWEPYSEGFPNVQVKWLEINYANNKLRAATYGRGLWEADLVCGYNDASGDETVFSQNTTLSSDKFFYNDIVVDNNATLTIASTSTVHMTGGAKILVKPGASLVVDGGRISSMCSDRWRGIYVSGNSTASQTQSPTLFGKLTVKNGAIIEHVQDGICNFGLTSGGTTDWSSFGGIIQAKQSSFVNNRYGPYFGPYSNFLLSGGNQYPTNDLSYFDRCEFRTDDDFGSGTPIDQMTQWEVRGVAVIGCLFHNTRASADGNPVGRGRGIYSIDAVYTVKDHCTITPPAGQPCPAQNRTPSRFERLHRGIEATGGGVKPAVTTVWESEFTDNHRGVILSNTEGSKVQRNIFRPGLTGPEPVGLYIDQTSSYTVDCNTFTTVGSTPPITYANYRYGVTSINCGVASMITKNTFTGLYVGAQALGSNRNSSGTGLQYRSNTFNGNYVGAVILPSGSLPNQGIASFQGTTSAPAGNLFSTASTLLDFYNFSQHVTYRHHAGTGAWIPTIIPSTTTLSPTSVAWSLWTCEEKKEKSMAMFGDETQQQAAKEAELTALTDGGSTQQLQTQVAATGSEADMQVYGALMQKSPNLSEQVLLTAVERNAALPNAMLRDVLVSNPQAGKSEEVMTGLADRPQQLPEFMLWQVEESSAGVSPMENLRADVASLSSQRQQTAEGLLDRWLMPEDGQPLQRDSAIALLTAKDDAHAHHRLALLHAAEGDSPAAAHHAGLMGQRADGPGAEAAQRLSSLLTLLATVNAEGRSLGQLTEGELSTLTGLKDGDDRTAGRADAIVAFVNGTVRDYPVLPLPPMPQQRRAMPSMDGMSEVKVFPNPGTDHVTIDFAFEEPEGNRQFEIVDVQGRTLLSTALVGQRDQKLVDVRSLAVGSYTYRVSDNGHTVASGIFTVGGR